jgi:hypothetical protein
MGFYSERLPAPAIAVALSTGIDGIEKSSGLIRAIANVMLDYLAARGE